jgi:hypothetical protein
MEQDDPEAAAKAKAEENKRSFQEAIKRNKERILGAVAARPTLMERFEIDKKREESKVMIISCTKTMQKYVIEPKTIIDLSIFSLCNTISHYRYVYVYMSRYIRT